MKTVCLARTYWEIPSSFFEIGVKYGPRACGSRSILNPNFSEFRWYFPIRPRQTHSILSILYYLYCFWPNFGPNLTPRPIWPKVTITPWGVPRPTWNILDAYHGHLGQILTFIAEESYITLDLALLLHFDHLGQTLGQIWPPWVRIIPGGVPSPVRLTLIGYHAYHGNFPPFREEESRKTSDLTFFT